MSIQSRILRSTVQSDYNNRLENLGWERFGDLGGEFAVARSSMVIGAAPVDGGTIERGPGDGTIQTYVPGNLAGANVTDNATFELDGLSSIVSADVGGTTYVFAAGGVDDGISVFSISATGVLTNVFNVDDASAGALELDGARGLSTAMVDGNTYLFVAGQADNGVSVFRVNTNGSLVNVANVNDDATMLLTGVSDTATARVGAFTYLYTAGTTENGISIFRVAGDGRLTYLSNHIDAGALELAGVRAMSTVMIGGTAFLIAGGTDDGISVFSINAATGALTSTDDENDTGSINLNDVSDITTAVIGGVTYVFVAGAADNGVSVFSLSGAGVLTHIESENDGAATLAAGANSVSVTVVGGIAYLHVGGTENGTNLYLFNPAEATGRVLLHADQLADTASRELSGTTTTATASVGGTTYLLGGGATDDGFSAFGSSTNGQLWYSTAGNLADARIAFVNTDGFNHVSFIDNNPATQLTTAFIESIALDTAAGLYYILATGHEGINAKLLMGHIGSTAAPTVVFTFDPTYTGALNSENNLAFGIEIDTITHKLYIGFIEFNPTFGPTTQGIRQFDYNTGTGTVTGGTFFVTESSTPGGVPSSAPGGDGLFASRDLDIDTTHNVLYSQQLALGDGFETNNILRFSLSAPGAGTVLLNPALFAMNGDGSDFTTVNGIIADIEVDEDSNRLYFLTRAEDVEEAGTEDSIWRVDNASTASNATPVKVTIVGSADFAFTLANFYPTDMIMDEVNDILYVESENSNLPGGGATDAIFVFQLNAAGTQATLINVIDMRFNSVGANVEGLHFNYLATLSGLTATGTAATEQGAAVDLLGVAPGISDFDGNRLAGATVQITGGSFNSNENSANDDDLGYTASMTQSGLIAGTNITISWNQATGTLTLTGYDTFTNYSNVLNSIFFQSTGDNPTNYGLNTTRTITWTISDGSPGIPTGSANSKTTQLTITAANDAPVNAVGGTLGATEDATIVVTGVSVSDVDANPGITDITVTLTVQHGTITLLTNVAGGLIAADVAGNGTATVTITATINEINATFSGSGLTYTPTGDYNGADTLQIVTNDGGNTGTGGALSDTDNKSITIAAVNDAPTVIDATQTAATILEDTPSAAGESVSSLFTASFSDATDQQQTGGNPTGSVANTLAGIAVVGGSTSASGSWQYLNGATWVDIGAASTASAVLISAGTAIRFNPALNFNGSPPDLVVHLVDSSGAAITNGATVNLTGATGGTTRYSSATVALSESVTAVNDAPVNTVGGTLTVAEDSSANNVTGMSISDVDANPATDVFTVILDVLHGTLNLSGVIPSGVLAANITGNGTATVTVTGTINQINTTLAAAGGLTYTPTGNYNGSDRVQITTDDGGATGLDPGATGGATSEADIDSKAISVTAVNDPVTGTAPATATVSEDATNVAIAGMSISDIDATLNPAGVYEVTLSSTNGTMTLTTLAGLTFTGGSDGTADATMTFHGTLAAINTALATANYTPTANYNGTATITLAVTDTFGGIVATGTGAATNDSDIVNVTVTAVNDPISTNAPATATLAEDATNVAIAGLSISDIDATLAPAGVYDVTLTATNGTLTLTTLTGLTFTVGDGTADATMTFHGTLADLNTALATATYTPTANYNGAATITFSATDTFGGIVATGTGAATNDSDVVNVTVTAVNDTPVVAVAASVSSTEQVAGTIDAAASITDLELGALNNYAGSTLTVGRNGGPAAEDLLTFGASGAFTVSGANLQAGGLTFATFAGGNGANLVISFTGSGTPATQALVDAVIQSLQYTYTGDTPPVSIVMNYTFNDGAPANAGQGPGGSPTGTDAITINITDTPENSPPTLDLDADNSTAAGSAYAGSFTEGGAAVAIVDTDVAIADVDAGDMIEGATIAIQGPLAGDQLVLGPQGGFVVTGSGTGTITITGTGTAAQYQTMLAAITFQNTSDDPGASRTINITVSDGTDTSNVAVATITITQINDEPTLAATGASVTLTEGGAAVDLFSAVTASTIEAGQTFTSLTVTVSNVTDGASELLGFDGSNIALTNGNAVTTATNGLNVTVTVAGNLATLTFSGASLSAAALQTLIDAMSYRNISENPTDANRVVTITQLVDSGSNTPPNDNTTALSIAATVNVDPVNDAPVNTVPGTQTINEDASLTLSTGNGNAISVVDVDATTLTVTLTVAHGTLTIASTLGLTFSGGSDGTNDATMTFSGTAAAINAALGAGLTYNPNANFNGSDSIAVSTTDNGQSGGPTQTDNDSVAINITAINDAPVVIGDGTESATTINEDTPGAGQTIQALFAGQYSDAADNQVPNGGASSPGQFSGIAVTANGSSAATGQWQYFSGGVWTDIGAVSDAAAKLLGDPFVTLIRFNPAANFNGPAPTLTVHLIDNSLGFGIVNGQVVNLSGMGATGGTTAYSSGIVVLSQDVTAVNDAPLNNVPGSQTINEDASFTLSTGNGNAISVADVDATTLTVTLTVAHGTLTLASTLGLSFGAGDGTADVTMTFSGTAAAINAALGSGLTYNPTANYNGPDSITVLTIDNGQTGTGGTLQDNDSIAITINSVNDAPSGADKTLTGSEDDPLVLTATDFGFSDPIEGNAFLAVIIDTFPANGTLFLDSDGPGGAAPVNLALVGPGVFVSIIDINAGHLYFQPDPDEFGNGYAQFTFRVQDDGGMLNGGVDRDPVANTIFINITPDNLPPAVDLDGVAAGINYATTYVEDGAAVAIGSGVSVTDPNSGTGDLIESATITLTDRVAGDSLTLTGALPPGITAVTTPSVGSITIQITGPGTGAQYQALIQSIVYATTNQDPTVGGTDPARTVTVVVNDGLVDSPVATTTINITAVDDAPVAQPDAFTVLETGTIVAANLFANNGSGADADPDGPPLAISAVNGMAVVGMQITLASGAHLTVNANGTFNYDPNGAFNSLPDFVTSGASNTTAPDTFTYTLAGGNTVTVTLTVRGVDSNGDILLGTPGVDTLNGGIGADTMTGFAGNDTFLVDNAGDVVVETAGGGDDIVRTSVSYTLGAGVSVETLTTTNQAGVGAIDLTGNELDNQIEGNDGVNVLTGNGGIDKLFGFGGNDMLIGGAGNDQLDGGAGLDTATFTGILNFNDTPVGWIAVGVDGNDVLQNVEIAVEGSGRRNLLVGSTGFTGIQVALDAALAGDAVRLAAGVYTGTWTYSDAGLTVLAQPGAQINGSFLTAGTDGIVIAGANLADNITTGAGNDTLSGGGGADTLAGGLGNDLYIVDNAGDVVNEAAAGGSDTVVSSVSYTLTAGSEVELMTTGSVAGTGAIDLTGNGLANQIWGNAAANTLSGGGGNDILIGFGGNDTLFGGAGADTMLGGTGDDLYFVDDAGDALYETAGEGSDVIASSVSYTLTAGSSIELFTAGSVPGTGAIDLTGNELDNQIWGNDGVNVLNGGLGNDILIGFGGADTYAFTTALGAGNIDSVITFNAADDTIALDDAVFTALGLGALNANAFVVGTAAADADDRIIYDASNGALYYDADGNGAGAAVHFATLLGTPVITASDFTVI